MNRKIMKTLAGFAVLLMVFSVMPSSTLAAETDTPDNGENGVCWFKERPANTERNQLTDEEKIDFMKTRMLDRIDRQIERLENIDIENIEDETITSDVIDGWITQLNDIRDSIDSDDVTEDEILEARDEFHTLMQEICSAGICCISMDKPMGKQMGHRFCGVEE